MIRRRFDVAWTQLAPAVEFGGVARDPAYETAIQDALDAETAIAEAEAQLENKRVTRKLPRLPRKPRSSSTV